MTVFHVVEDPFNKLLQISALDLATVSEHHASDDRAQPLPLVPVATFLPARDSEFDRGTIQKMAQNFASLMSGDGVVKPSISNPGQQQIYFERLGDSGVALRVRGQEGGISQEAVSILVNPHAGAFTEEVRARMTPDFMKDLCGAMETPKMSAAPQPGRDPGLSPGGAGGV